jgi:hypothetical protein
MKSILRLSATLGLIGSTVLASLFGNSLPALALSAEQIVEKLKVIPVFTIADEQGAPLVASNNNEESKKVTGVFISKQDAQKFVEDLKKNQPEIGNKVKVVPVSLAEVYKLEQNSENQQNQQNNIDFAYVPVEQQVESAKNILGQQGKKYEGGVPLFVAKGGQSKGYLTIEQNNQQVIPFFFEQKQIQEMVERFKQQKPDLASTVTIEVVPLEGVIATLQQSNDQMLDKILLVPSTESIEFLRSLKPNQSTQPAQPTQPTQPK